MGLFHLIKQDHAVGPAAHLFRELSAVLMAHIPRRRANEAGNGVPLHIFTHIKAQQGFFVPEQDLRQCLAKLRFSDTRRPQE